MNKLGFSGRVAERFQLTQITPLLALVGLLLGFFAVLVTPREEEPQINVTFANVFIPFPGASATEVEHLVAGPAEQVLSEIDGIKHVYSTSQPGMAVITVQFRVGEDRDDAIVRLFSKVYSNQDWLPPNLGVGQPIVKPKGIDDVPIVSATLWSEDPAMGAYELGQVAHAIESELKRVPGTRDIYTIGSPDRVVSVRLDPQALAGYGIDLDGLRNALQATNRIRDNLPVTSQNREILVQAGSFLTHTDEIGALVVGVHSGKPVFLRDVAEVSEGPDQPEQYVWLGTGPQADTKGFEAQGSFPSVTIAVAKKPGTNAVQIARRVIDRFEQLRGTFIPDGVQVTITRDYGATADAKAKKLISKLAFATASVVFLVLLALGWREAIIVGAAVVVVENIHRHLALGAKNLAEAIPKAVDEVGGPTILATFTVIAALLPMAFVSGLMGPYMSPIPINASMGMLISLAVAFVFTPWMTQRMLGGVAHGQVHAAEHGPGRLHGLFARVMRPFLDPGKGRRNRWLLLGGIMTLIALSVSLTVTKSVVLKMLPFDNKSEFQVVLDMPEGTALEQTTRVLEELATHVATIPEVSDYQVYAGTAAPISFNGLVRQYYLREGANLGDIQVNLVEKQHRERKSHEIALAEREHLQAIARRYGGNAKIVEVPPGPPVMSPLVAEVYGINYVGQIETARQIRGVFEHTADIVDVDDSVEFPSWKSVLQVDRAKAARLGVTQSTVAQALATVLKGEDMGFLHGENNKYAVPVRVKYAEQDKSDLDQVLALRVRSEAGALVPLSPWWTASVPTRSSTRTCCRWSTSPATWQALPTARCTACSTYSASWTNKACSNGCWPSRTTPMSTASNGTANGRSPTKPSATWASPTRWACC
jgi:multidrug efflux pump subunit AcrB